MTRTIGRLRLVFLGLFLLGAIGVGVYQFMWVLPERACIAKARWWDARTRSCGIPVWIPDLTGRPSPAGVERPRAPIRD
jgi:hypothetical protein